MTANYVLAKIPPLVSTPEVCLYTLANTEKPHAEQIRHATSGATLAPRGQTHRPSVIPDHLRSIQYPLSTAKGGLLN
jgi:hypothetical protein